MGEMMTFPETIQEFLEQYKIVDTEQVYTYGAELVPIFRVLQWYDAHITPAKPQTNADKYFRNATDEELADFIGGIFTLDSDVWGDYDPRTVVMQEPRVEVRNKEEMLEWLKQEVESDA